MTTVLAVVNTKGGVGKTTTAMFLAREYADRGERVVVVDLDPQGTASEWADLAAEAGDPLPFDVAVTNAKRLAALADSSQYTVIIVDTPPGLTQIIDAAIAAADFIVVPTQPSGPDISRTWATLSAVIDRKPYAVLLASAVRGTTLLRDIHTILNQERTSFFDAVIHRSESIRKAWGAPPPSNADYRAVVNELEAVLA